MNTQPEPITIGLIAHWAFCPRRAWLEAAGEHTDTAQMQAGTDAHHRTDDSRTAKSDDHRAVDVFHDEWGVTGRLDTVSDTPDGLIIREYKATPVRRRAEVTEPMRMQLALQESCLRSMGHDVAGVEVFFTTHHRRVPVTLTQRDYEKAEAAVESTRAVVTAQHAPKPLEDNPKCTRCSHAGVCLPDERKLSSASRRIVVSDPDTQIVHLTTPGARAYTRGGQMIVIKGDETLAKLPLEQVQGVQVHGNIDMSSGLMRELLWRGLVVVWCSSTGRVNGWAVSSMGPNGALRVAQHVASAAGRLAFAREFVSAKIANQATQLRRAGVRDTTLAELRMLQRRASSAQLWQDILGVEGEAASIYFQNWPLLLKERERANWVWSGRSGRPASDPINAMLNFGYALLVSDAVRAIVSCGLDPHAGFLHSSGRNKPALALDLVEEFRAPIVDSVVQTVINNGEVKPHQFTDSLGSWRMTGVARRALIAAYERRMTTTVKHPIFGYPATWRRVMEIQARQVLGVLDGSQPEYRGVRVR